VGFTGLRTASLNGQGHRSAGVAITELTKINDFPRCWMTIARQNFKQAANKRRLILISLQLVGCSMSVTL